MPGDVFVAFNAFVAFIGISRDTGYFLDVLKRFVFAANLMVVGAEGGYSHDEHSTPHKKARQGCSGAF